MLCDHIPLPSFKFWLKLHLVRSVGWRWVFSLLPSRFAVMSEPDDLILPPQVCLVKRFQRKRSLDTAESVPFIPPAPKFGFMQAPSPCRWDGLTVSDSWRPRFPTPATRPPNVVAAATPMKKSGTFAVPCTASGLVYSRPRLGVHSAALKSLYALAPPPKQPCRPSWPTLPGLAGDGSTSGPLTNDKPFQVSSTNKAETMQSVHSQLKAQHMVVWLSLLESAGQQSTLFRDTASSDLSQEHRARVVERFAPSTMSAYLRMWDQWKSFCEAQSFSPWAPSSIQLADFFHVHSRSTSSSSALGHYKALVWVAKYAGLPTLTDMLGHAMVKSYSIATTPGVRREAMPLPLSFISWLESEVVHEKGTALDTLLMGCVLVLVWSSLRWSDAQWVSPADLVEDQDCIRGIALRTKSTKRGMPFGFLRSGFLGHSVRVAWSSKWLNVLRRSLATTARLHPGFKPDFLIPCCGGTTDDPWFSTPMSRAQGIITLRKLLLRWDANATLNSIGVHSCKVTFLSWARQLNIAEELRMAQGHHRGSSASATVALYSRDDVHPALQVQKVILQKVLDGFRPIIPMLRGGQVPIQEQPISLPAPLLSRDTNDEFVPTGIAVPEIDDCEDTDSASSETLYEADVLHTWSPGVPSFKNMQDCIFLLNNQSHVAHVATKCAEDDPAVVCASDDFHEKKFFMFACGARQANGEGQISPSEIIPPNFRLCLRPACAQIFD